jgi:hypothetical protein
MTSVALTIPAAGAACVMDSSSGRTGLAVAVTVVLVGLGCARAQRVTAIHVSVSLMLVLLDPPRAR